MAEENVTLEDILGDAPPEIEEVGEFNPTPKTEQATTAVEREDPIPAAPEETADAEVVEPEKETSTKELSELEQQIEDAKEKVESDLRARAAAKPPKMAECIILIPELKDMNDVERLTYLHAQIQAYDVPYGVVSCAELLAVRLSNLRVAEGTE
jgi:hypothetical protein